MQICGTITGCYRIQITGSTEGVRKGSVGDEPTTKNYMEKMKKIVFFRSCILHTYTLKIFS